MTGKAFPPARVPEQRPYGGPENPTGESMQNYFQDKVCVVTGAASGIGLQIAKDLLDAGAVVFMADAHAENLARCRDETAADNAHALVTDVTQEEQVRALVERAASHNGRLDILFNNAGVGGTMPWEDISLDFWRRVININLWGVIHGLHYAVPIMRKQGHGHIVNTSSLGGLLNIPYQAVYCASKAAVAAIGECLRFELADENIHVTTVYPGNVATAIFAETGAMPADAIPVREAVQNILDAVSRKESMAVFPEASRLWAKGVQSIPEFREKTMLELARERRRNYQAKGRYF
jgi:NAD(P)-dependent dehydrogenase (short-subunit alcohol dehydrogenase family)